jgi:curved DNA-binding protein CbpA
MAESFYDALNVPPDADEDAIASSYLRLRERHHPRNNPNDPFAPKLFAISTSAYAVLIEPERRRGYDAELQNGHSPNGIAVGQIGIPTLAVPIPAKGSFVPPRLIDAPPQSRVGAYFRLTFRFARYPRLSLAAERQRHHPVLVVTFTFVSALEATS